MRLLTLLCLPALLGAQAPTALLGIWADDYGSRHRISDTLWSHEGANRYIILRWDSAGQFLIARNATSNASDQGLFTRIDWMPLAGMAPWEWAFCLSTWNAPTADSAARVSTARRDTPRTGCGGFPFTRLQPEALDAPAGSAPSLRPGPEALSSTLVGRARTQQQPMLHWRASGTTRGMLIGGGIGVALSALMLFAYTENTDGGSSSGALPLIVGSGAVGAVIGAAIGSRYDLPER